MSARVSIPGSVRRTIQNIKEIAGNHSDEEVYAMLKECAMDPNETTQRLLLQDTFHEVKRKRDKRKENTKEFTDSRWRPGLQGRGSRGGRGSFSSRSIANDVNNVRNAGAEKENRINQSTEKNTGSTQSPIMHDAEIKSTTPLQSSVGVFANGPSNAESLMPSHQPISQEVGLNCIIKAEENSATESIKKGPLADAQIKTVSGPSFPGSESPDQLQSCVGSASIAGVYASASDPVLVPSFDTHAPALVGAIKREVGNKRSVEKALNSVVSHDVADSELPSTGSKESSELKNDHMHGKLPSKALAVEANQLLDAPQDASSSLVSSVGSRPSSNYSSRSQQQSAPHKGKEWKAKPTQVNSAQVSGVHATSDIVSIPAEAVDWSVPASSSTGSEDVLPKLQKKLEDLHFSDTKLVIIPNHLQVPESERSGFSFGSFDANFGLVAHSRNCPDSEKISTPLSETSQDIEEYVEEPSSSIQVPPPTTQEVAAAYPEDLHSSTQMAENLSSREADISSGGCEVREYDQSKPESTLAPEGPQHSVIHTTPTYSTLGLVPQMLSQFATFEGTENQPRDASRVPSFVVQHHFDPSASYYTPFYRPPIDGDGRFSPFLPPGAAAKFNGNIAVLPAQSGQSPQESGNSLVVSSAVPTPVATQVAGVIQSPIPGTQQPVPVFRQPAGVHISHYHPNYLPYSQYVSPFFVPPANIHPFLSNSTFPQQPPTGSIFAPAAPVPSATPLKYTISQFKSGTNNGNSTHVGVPTGYGMYNLTTAGYSPNPTVTSGNSTSNDDLTASQFKENNVYMTGQQSEGSAVWIPASGRDISALQPGSFYNLSPPGQPLSFAPSQAGHGTFTGIYHPTQTVAATAVQPLLPQSQPMSGAVEMMGPPAGVYQQPQRAQINWGNNC